MIFCQSVHFLFKTVSMADREIDNVFCIDYDV